MLYMKLKKILIFLLAACIGGIMAHFLIGGHVAPILVAIMYGFIWTSDY